MDVVLYQNVAGKKIQDSSALSLLRVYEQAVVALRPLMGGHVFQQVFEKMATTKLPVFFSGVGKSGYVAQKIASSLASIGFQAYFIDPLEAAHGGLGVFQRGALLFVLSKSGETVELFPLMTRAAHIEMPLVVLTCEPQSALGKLAKWVLAVPREPEICPLGLAPTTSTFLMLAVGDILLAKLAAERKLSPDAYKCFHPSGQLGWKLKNVKEAMRCGDALPLVSPDDSMADVIQVMTSKCAGCAVVADGAGRVKGLISDGDLRRLLKTDFFQKTAGVCMTKNPLTISETARVSEALVLMSKTKVNALIVVRGEHIIGLITWQDCMAIKNGFIKV